MTEISNKENQKKEQSSEELLKKVKEEIRPADFPDASKPAGSPAQTCRGSQELLEKIRELEEKTRPREQRVYKSRLFSFIFGREENKAWTLALYNAVRGTDHTDPKDITINTLEDTVYMGMKNDLSLLVSDEVCLYRSMEIYEEQSSYNPNMPVRQLMYAGKLYDSYLYTAKLNRYGKKLLPLPIPKLVVFYNGEEKREDQVTLCLSDSFREEIRRGLHAKNAELTGNELEAEVERVYKEADPDIDVRVRMININYDHNQDILEKCKPLEEYAWLISKVRELNLPDQKGERMGIEEALDRAIDEMPEDFLIKGFIMKNRAEVKDMCLTEYDEEQAHEWFREEGREEERTNTERERQRADTEAARADTAEARADTAEAELARYKEKYGKL